MHHPTSRNLRFVCLKHSKQPYSFSKSSSFFIQDARTASIEGKTLAAQTTGVFHVDNRNNRDLQNSMMIVQKRRRKDDKDRSTPVKSIKKQQESTIVSTRLFPGTFFD
jgi:hypothetical protein